MKIVSMFVSLFVALNVCAAGHKELPAKGDLNLTVFDKENIRFVPDAYAGYSAAGTDGVIHLVNGRIILKKIQVPDYQRDVTVSLKVTVASNGDRWDKSGSVLLLPSNSVCEFADVIDHREREKFPENRQFETGKYDWNCTGKGLFANNRADALYDSFRGRTFQRGR